MSIRESEFEIGSDGSAGIAFHRNLHPLHEAAMRLAEFRPGRKRGKSKELVALLLSHGARAWRSAQPAARVHLHVAANAKRKPVVIRIG
jgi:hypothetical protein